MKTIGRISHAYDVVPVMVETAKSPALERMLPTIGNGLYLPVFEMRRPMPNVAAVTPSIWGMVRRPDSVGEINCESWKYRLRNVPAP